MKTACAFLLLLAAQDTGRPGIAVQDDGKAVPAGETVASFKGDAVVSNGRISVAVRRHVELRGAGKSVVARLALMSAVERVSLVEHTKAVACLEIAGKTEKGIDVTARLRVKRGEIFVEVEPGPGAERVRVECPSRFVVLPDFFADDIVIDARKIPGVSAEIPSENFLLHLAGKGEAVVMCVFKNREQEVRLTLGGEGEERAIGASEIEFGKGGKVWVALMEAPRIWHATDVTDEDAKKVMKLDWNMPFTAQWRCDFTRTNGLTDSWEMLLQEKEGGPYVKPSWMGSGPERVKSNRERWTTVLDSFKYPCWSDPERKGYLQPIKHKALAFRGPAVIYPVNRVPETPLDAFTVVDVMRNTLGVGPCEYIMDLEGQKNEYKGRATCSVRDTLTPIYQKGRQKEKRAQVDKTLDEGLAFVKHIRGRIDLYVEFGKKMREYLAEQKKARPELEGPIAEIDELVREIDRACAAREEKIKTPEHVALMNDDFRKNVLDYEGDDAPDRCKKYTKALVEIGDNQDELSGECRWAVKALRQKAGLMMAVDPRMAGIGAEIRKRTQEVLRNPASHEGARH